MKITNDLIFDISNLNKIIRYEAMNSDLSSKKNNMNRG